MVNMPQMSLKRVFSRGLCARNAISRADWNLLGGFLLCFEDPIAPERTQQSVIDLVEITTDFERCEGEALGGCKVYRILGG